MKSTYNGTFAVRAGIALVAGAALLSTTASAQRQYGNAEEAKAMLVKAIAAVKADKSRALELFNKGEGGFLDRDLFPFCFNIGDGRVVATQVKQSLGQDVRTFKDASGRVWGPSSYDAGQHEDRITEINIMFPRPGADTTPVAKVVYITGVGDLGCGVGTHK